MKYKTLLKKLTVFGLVAVFTFSLFPSTATAANPALKTLKANTKTLDMSKGIVESALTLKTSNIPDGEVITWTVSGAGNALVELESEETSVASNVSRNTLILTGSVNEKTSVDVTAAYGTKSRKVTITLKKDKGIAVTASPDNLECEIGKTALISVDTYPDDAEVTFSTSKAKVAEVSEDGTVTGLTAGTATITVTAASDGKEAKDTVRVKVVRTKLTVEASPAVILLSEGKTAQISVSTDPNDADVAFSSNRERVASVSDTGVVTALNTGAATITVTARSNGKTATDTIRVNVVSTLSIEATPAVMNLSTGKTEKINVTTYPADANVNYTTDNASVATVSGEGEVTGLATGTAIITATAESGGKTASDTVKITVIENELIVEAAPNEIFLAVGKEQQINAVSNVEGATYTYASGNTPIAAVSSTGLVTGVAEGSTTITVTAAKDNKTATDTVQVTVTDNALTVEAAPAVISMEKGATEQITAISEPAGAAISYASNKIAVAAVSASGLVTGIGAGDAIITVTAEKDGKTATDTVLVTVTEEILTIKAISPIADINTYVGIQPVLPAIAVATLSNDSNRSFSVAWVTADVASIGTKSIAGTLILPADVTNPNNLKASVNIIVAAAPVTPVYVTGITVTSAGDATDVVNGSTLQLGATVTPANASNKTITWSVVPGTGTATINATGLLAGTGVGTVTAKATNTASGVSGTKVINVTPATTDVTSSAFSTSSGNNKVTITLTGGTYKSAPITAGDFSFAGTDALAIAAGSFARTSDTVVTVTNISLSGGADNTVTVKASTQATQAASVEGAASTVVPGVLPTAGSFTDTDTDGSQIGGTISWTAASPTTGITGYKIYWGSDATTILAGTPGVQYTIANPATVSQAVAGNTALPAGAAYYLIYSYNAAGNSTGCLPVAIVDASLPTVLPTAGSFSDADTDADQISGTVSWTAASPSTGITGYKIYWGSDATTILAGTPGVQHTIANPATVSQAVAGNTALPAGAAYYLIYSYNTVGNSASCLAIAISDLKIPTVLPTGGSFTDTDVTANQLGGTISWTAASPTTGITGYKIYWGSNATTILAGTPGVQYTVAGAATTSQVVAANTALAAGATHYLIYSYNAAGNSASCLAVAITDVAVPEILPTVGSFTDTDNDGGQVAGTISWTAASPTTGISGYKIYWGSDATTILAGTPGVQYTVSDAAATSQAVAANTALAAGAAYYLIYSYNGDGNSASCLAIAITDAAIPTVLPTGGGFTDTDTDGSQLAGTIYWTAASPTTGISGYKIYWGANATTILAEEPAVQYTVAGAAATSQVVAANTAKPAGATCYLIYSYNAAGNSTNCLPVGITDKAVPTVLPTAGSFTDTDTDGSQLAGTIYWTAASPATGISGYKIYWGSDPTTILAGTPAVQYTIADPATTSQVVAANTARAAGATHYLVYSYNGDGNSASCLAIAITDAAIPTVLPTGGSFIDTDTDGSQLAGTISWTAASPTTGISGYKIYWGSNATTILAGTPAVQYTVSGATTTSQVVAANTALAAGATHYLVYSYNGYGNSASCLAITIADVDGSVNSATFTGATDNNEMSGITTVVLTLTGLSGVQAGSTFNINLLKYVYIDGGTPHEAGNLSGNYNPGTQDQVDSSAGYYYYDASAGTLAISLTADDDARIVNVGGPSTNLLTALNGWNTTSAGAQASQVTDIGVDFPY